MYVHLNYENENENCVSPPETLLLRPQGPLSLCFDEGLEFDIDGGDFLHRVSLSRVLSL